jgi:hypothetical protein
MITIYHLDSILLVVLELVYLDIFSAGSYTSSLRPLCQETTAGQPGSAGLRISLCSSDFLLDDMYTKCKM